MSSARKRRAELVQNPPPPGGAPKLVPAFNAGVSSQQSSSKQGQPQAGVHMTLQQIINITDKRLTSLEKQMVETNRSLADVKNAEPMPAAATSAAATANSSVDLEELYEGFNVLMNEVSQIKETLMKLQTYTLEVNHVLVESKIGKNNPDMIPTPPPIIDSETTDVAQEAATNDEAEAETEQEVVPEPVPEPVQKGRRGVGIRQRR